MEEIKKDLPAIIEESGIETNEAITIRSNFDAFLAEIGGWKEKAYAINITSPEQKSEIAEAKKALKIVSRLRLDMEQRRKDLKNSALRRGQLIDGIAKYGQGLIAPIEDHLEKNAKFVENLEKEALAKKIADRKTALLQYVLDISGYNLEEMSDQTFNELLVLAKTNFENKKLEAEKLEKERKEKEEATRIENERIRLENEKLRIENEKKDAENKKLEDEIKEKKRLETERIERERNEKIEAEAARLKAEKDARMAPDKDKLFVFAETIKNIVGPQDLSVEAQAIVKETEKKLLIISQTIKDFIKNL